MQVKTVNPNQPDNYRYDCCGNSNRLSDCHRTFGIYFRQARERCLWSGCPGKPYLFASIAFCGIQHFRKRNVRCTFQRNYFSCACLFPYFCIYHDCHADPSRVLRCYWDLAGYPSHGVNGSHLGMLHVFLIQKAVPLLRLSSQLEKLLLHVCA